jgi:hypothetical protein
VPIFPVPFLIIGLFLVWLDKKCLKKTNIITALVVIAILSLNLYGIKQWFTETKLSQTEAVSTERTLILQKDDGITLGQFQRAVDYILENSQDDHVLLWTKTEYKQPLKYLLEQARPGVDWDFVAKEKELYNQQALFAINTVTGGYKSVSKSVQENTNLLTSTQFGQILVMQLSIDPTNIPEPIPETEKEAPKDGSSKTERLFWKDVF